METEFQFGFKDKLHDAVTYTAMYSGNNDLKVSMYDHGKPSKNGYVDSESCRDPWGVFYRHATFEEILHAVNVSMPYLFETTYSKAIKALKDGDKRELLSSIRDVPWLLYEKQILDGYIEIMETARWSLDSKNAEGAKIALSRHLIPQSQGGKRPLPPNLDLRLARDITKRLAKHLSEKYRKAIDCYTHKEGETLNAYDYNLLIEWAEKNRELRISPLSIDELSLLVYKPATFANGLMAAHLRASLKTMERRQVK